MAESSRLLVVDDNEDNRDLLAKALSRRGYQVVLAEDGPSALTAVGQGGVDLVLLDVMMPGMSGVDVLRCLRQSHSEVELPVLMVTARNDSDEIVEALNLGANDYITKPLDLAVTVARVNRHLRQRATAQTLLQDAGELAPGTVLGERYRIEAPIGEGACGIVYRARQLDIERLVAIKVLRGAGGHPVLAARFRREILSACRVNHPNAVSVLDFRIDDWGRAYLVMELLSGRSLAEALRQMGRLPPDRAAAWLIPVCGVLAAAHAVGVIHRDIKPSNIFLHETPTGTVVKVLDFGIAKVASPTGMGEALTLDGALLGTPAYMAPEQHAGRPCDGSADVYSLGVMLFEALTGRLPFGTDDLEPCALGLLHLHEPAPAPSAIEPQVPRELDVIVLACLRKRAEARPLPSAVAQALDPWL